MVYNVSSCLDSSDLSLQTSPDGRYIALSQDSDGSSTIDNELIRHLGHGTADSDEPFLSHQSRARLGGSITFHPESDAYTYSYGPKGLSGLWHNYYALLCAFFASIGGLTFGYDQGVVMSPPFSSFKPRH